MNGKALSFALVMSLAIPFVHATDQRIDTTDSDAVVNELLRQQDLGNAPVRSEDDLKAHLATDASPIDALSDGARALFLESLKFGEHGVASFRARELEAELTPTQIHAILKLFGFQRAISGFRNARIETEHDVVLLGIDGSTDGQVGASSCGEYVAGYCWDVGSCKLDKNYCCHPPSCRYITP